MRFSALLAAAAGTIAVAGCTTAPDDTPDAGRLAMSDAGAVFDDAGSAPTDAAVDPGPDAGSPSPDAGPPALCPPTGPFGDDPGEIAEDLVLMDCDGVAHSLHDLCERDVVWLFEMADWCPPCRAFADGDANRIYDRFTSESASFEGWMVISEDSAFAPADADDCAAVRDRYGIHMPVLYDPAGAFQAAFGVPSNEVHVVLRRGAVIDWIGHYAGDEVESRIESALDAP